MRFDNQLMAPVALALLTALVVSFLMTPVVKSFAYKVGAIDVPKDERRQGVVLYLHGGGGSTTSPSPGWAVWRSSPALWPASCCSWISD